MAYSKYEKEEQERLRKSVEDMKIDALFRERVRIMLAEKTPKNLFQIDIAVEMKKRGHLRPDNADDIQIMIDNMSYYGSRLLYSRTGSMLEPGNWENVTFHKLLDDLEIFTDHSGKFVKYDTDTREIIINIDEKHGVYDNYYVRYGPIKAAQYYYYPGQQIDKKTLLGTLDGNVLTKRYETKTKAQVKD